MSETNNYEFKTRVLMLLENGTWIAQGLDYDITGHGDSTEAALENFGKTLLGQALLDISKGERPLANVPEAPPFYWQRFERAEWHGERKRFNAPQKDREPTLRAFADDTRIYA